MLPVNFSPGQVDQSILLDAVTDRLTEAFAELIHLKMRKELWGYAQDEKLSLDDLLKVNEHGRRKDLRLRCAWSGKRSCVRDIASGRTHASGPPSHPPSSCLSGS